MTLISVGTSLDKFEEICDNINEIGKGTLQEFQSQYLFLKENLSK